MDFAARQRGLKSSFNHLIAGAGMVKTQFHPEKDVQVIVFLDFNCLPWKYLREKAEMLLRAPNMLYPNSDEIFVGKEEPDFLVGHICIFTFSVTSW